MNTIPDILEVVREELLKLPEQELQKILANRYIGNILGVLNENHQRKLEDIRVRNELACARMRARFHEKMMNHYNMLEAKVVCEICAISRQALSKWAQSGKVIAFTTQNRKYYPDFQFQNGQPNPAVKAMITAIKFDPKDSSSMNQLLGYLSNFDASYIEDSSHYANDLSYFENMYEMGK